jgi:hypothetical protein
LVYEVTVRKKLETKEGRIAALIHRRVPTIEEQKFEFTSRAKTVIVEMPEEAFYLEGVQVAKRGIALDVQKFFPEMVAVKFTETFKVESRKTETKPEIEKKAAAKAQSAT